MKNQESVKSPCVNVCQLGDDKICVGCYRTLEEIGAWSLIGEVERKRIVDNAYLRKSRDE